MKRHNRKTYRLRGYNYSEAGAYYVTICAKDRQCLFGEVIDGGMRLNQFGEIANICWRKLEHRFCVTLDQFVIMPNHVHGIILIESSVVGAIHELPLQSKCQHRRQMLLPKMMGCFKMNTAKQINELRKTPGISVWQRNYHDRIIRNETELNKIREYIRNNPLDWDTDPEK